MNQAQQLIDAFTSKLDIFPKFLSAGADISEIENAEKTIGLKFPEGLAQLLAITNGEGNKKYKYGQGLGLFAFQFLSLEEIMQQRQFSIDREDLEDEVYAPQAQLLTNNLYSGKRIPFAYDGSGQSLCIDFLPGPEGKEGQIIYLPCAEPEPICVISDNFNDFLSLMTGYVKSGKLALMDEREDWDPGDWEKADLYFYRTWRNDWQDIADEYEARRKK